MKIVIVDYQSGNLHSALKCFELAASGTKRANVTVSSDFKDIEDADRIVLPGVGSFNFCKSRLFENTSLLKALHERVIDKKVPFLGICVGMQLLATEGNEGEAFNSGLNWISGSVNKIEAKKNLKIPHMGWNNLDFKYSHELFKNIYSKDHFYFVHSYNFQVTNSKNLFATTEYGENITAAIIKDNIFGVQFHPEKSQLPGLKLIKNFINLNY